MKCPVCSNTALVMSERQGVEIDYCPDCRGIWLDRGELDKLLERAAANMPQAPSAAQPPQARRDPRPEYRHSDDDHYRHRHYKKSWLSDIFD